MLWSGCGCGIALLPLILLLSRCVTLTPSYVFLKYNSADPNTDFRGEKPKAPDRVLDLSYGGQQYLAVGKGFILKSKELSKGKKWKNLYVESNRSLTFHDASFGKGYWVVVGSEGTILVNKNSNSNFNWIRVPTETSKDLFRVAYGGGHWIAIGEDIILSTINPLGKWEQVAKEFSKGLLSLAYGDGKWGVLGLDGLLFSSQPLSLWKQSLFKPIRRPQFGRWWPYSHYAQYIYHTHLAYGNGLWLTVNRKKILVSTDIAGMWHEVYSDRNIYVKNISYMKGQWIAVGVGEGRESGIILRAKENMLTSWEKYETSEYYSFGSIVHGDVYWTIGAKYYTPHARCLRDIIKFIWAYK